MVPVIVSNNKQTNKQWRSFPSSFELFNTIRCNGFIGQIQFCRGEKNKNTTHENENTEK
jgi:hypothetical protein